MVRYFFLVALLATLGCSSHTVAQETSPSLSESDSEDESLVTGSGYRARYPLKNASAKLVDNTGLGFDNLRGTRNFRAVLNGVYYRGGANNAYMKPKPRANTNPLPNHGLENLCKEGFGHAVYLYSKNYETAASSVSCRTREGNSNTLTYLQISPLTYQESDQRKLLTLIHEHIRNPRLGPIYDHCWNGWHASGFVAAITLRQFCDFTTEQAIAYWNTNTDGNNGSGYNKVRDNIRKFTPYRDLSLSAAEKKVLCPASGSLNFR